ncbi:Hypothetical protein, putative, partial [Bodo saltans]
GCVLHPFATIDATNGPIHIGDYCIIDEGAELVVPPPLDAHSSNAPFDTANRNSRAGVRAVGAKNRGSGPAKHILLHHIVLSHHHQHRSAAPLFGILRVWWMGRSLQTRCPLHERCLNMTTSHTTTQTT